MGSLTEAVLGRLSYGGMCFTLLPGSRSTECARKRVLHLVLGGGVATAATYGLTMGLDFGVLGG
jgi:hypothetical protein